MPENLRPKVLVVAHDAGGAVILFSLAREYRRYFDWVICVSGPASDIFAKSAVNFSCIKCATFTPGRIKKILDFYAPDLILAGTGWQSDFEIKFLREAKNKGIRTAVFLDHWGNYRERFGTLQDWKKNLPDLIFVGDKWAYRVALKNGFPQKKMRVVENPDFKAFLRHARRLKRGKPARGGKVKVLYVSSPISAHALKEHGDPDYWKFTEFDILRDLLKITGPRKKDKFLAELRIRLHPAEKAGKYSGILKDGDCAQNRKDISFSHLETDSILSDCKWADVVIGTESMFLVYAVLCGKRSVSYVPGRRKKLVLPQEEIRRIYSFRELKREIYLPAPRKPDFRPGRENPGFNRYSFASAVRGLLDLQA